MSGINGVRFFWAWLALLCALVSPAHAKPDQHIIEIDQAESVFGSGTTIPKSGWKKGSLVQLYSIGKGGTVDIEQRTVWARMRFDRASLPDVPLALYTENNRDRVMVFLNGSEIFRNFSNDFDPVLGWNYPYLIRLPSDRILPESNEIILRVDTGAGFNLSIGTVTIGPNSDLESRYSRQMFLRIDAPRAANFAMLFLTGATLLLWLFRRHEIELLYLSLSGGLWFIRNYHFFATRVPGDPFWFVEITHYSTYFATAASLAFCITFLRTPQARRNAVLLFAVGGVLTIMRVLILQVYATDMVINLLTVGTSALVCGMIFWDWRSARSTSHLALFSVVVLTTTLSLHDIGRIPNIQWWDGMGFHIQPFIGALLSAIFLMAFGQRAVSAFRAVEGINQQLAAGIAEARAELAESEAARRKLEVEKALEGERERLMREVHDGIGSNIATAIAVAEEQKHPASTLATLRRAMVDLKLTVDSLEPVHGDVALLLGSFRHRVEPDLKKAGITIRWKAEICPPLAWLDATNALHVLRVLQEAVSNAVTHSGGKILTLGCREEERDGRAGVVLFVGDDGCGFDDRAREENGKGLPSMRSRIASLHGQFGCVSDLGDGTTISIWLPIVRPQR